MNQNRFSNSPHPQFEIHQINSTGKVRDSPTPSILKTPTAIFVTTRSSSAKTKRLTFANGPVDLQTLKNGTHESNTSFDSGVYTNGEKKLNNGEISLEDNNIVEVAISPVKTMKVSPESWNAFLEYRKYNDYANETEKTDYTYSRLSKYRHKEIIPGLAIRPNLSRLSINSLRSSFSFPSSQNSLNESYHTKSYDFKVFNHSDSEIFSDLNQQNKPGRSKYYLRSSSYDWKKTGESDSSAPGYLEADFYGSAPSEKITKSYAYTTTEAPEPATTATHYYGKVRNLELDDTDVDEVDDSLVISPSYNENRYYSCNDVDVDRRHAAVARPQTTAAGYLKNFFTTVFLYVTSVGTITKDLFSKYVLRRRDNLDGSQYVHHDWKSDVNYMGSTPSGSWIPWDRKRSYSTARYSDGYYGRPSSWSDRIYYYFSDRFSQLRNLIWGDSIRYTSSRHQEAAGKRKFWWFFIPLLLLAGSFLGYIDFFSNPKAILNIMYNCALFIPSFLHYTATVFIPWLIFEAAPYLVLQAIPNFVTVTLPYFFVKAVPYYFWVVVHFFAGLSLAAIWNALTGALTFALNLVSAAGVSFYNLVLSLVSSGYFLSSKYLMLFYSNFCLMMFHSFTVLCGVAFYFADLLHHAVGFASSLFL